MIDETWTPARVARLRELWDEGLTLSEIGRRMELSKNAVVGKVVRLALVVREKPIKQRRGAPVDEPKPILAAVATSGCRWPAWGATKGDLRDDPRPPTEPQFCGGRRVVGKPYCTEHAARATNGKSVAKLNPRGFVLPLFSDRRSA